MKKLQKALALLLSTLSLATIGLTACNKNPGTQNSGQTQSSSSGGSQSADQGGNQGGGNQGGGDQGGGTGPEKNPEYVYDGTHIYTATDTNDYLVKAGKTDYTLVIPEETTSALRTARTEFEVLFREATNITITIKSDNEVTDASQGKFISLGRTKLLENSGITVDAETLTADGHRVVTKGDDIYIFGGADEGTVFGVYTFMSVTFNYETYYLDCMEIEKTSEKKLKNYDVTDIPDFKYRAHSSDVTTYASADYNENMYAWRLRYYGKEGTRAYFYMPVHNVIDDFTSPSGASTNADHWFNEAIYKNPEDEANYHPKWFSDLGGEQLCFSAHGDPEEYELMVDTAFRKVESHLKHYNPQKYPKMKIMTLTHMDNRNYCTCNKCFEISSTNGNSQAAVQILFMNDLAKRVDELLENNKDASWYRPDFKLLFFAYNHNYDPPAYYDAVSKKYVPYSEDVVVHDRVIAWFCRNSNGQQVFDEGLNAMGLSILKGWAAVAKNIQFWNYGTNFRNYMMPLDSFQYATSEMFGFWCNQSDTSWFTQYQDKNNCRNTGWHHLKVYLDSKLAWDTSLDQSVLTEKWMKAMFKDAAPTMLRLFQAQRTYIRHVLIDKYELESNGDGSPDVMLVEYWPLGIVNGWINSIDKALEEIARYETLDPVLYDKLAKRIEIENVSYLYIMLAMHGKTIAAEDKDMYVTRLKKDIKWLDISGMYIHTGSKQYLEAWVNGL